MNNSVQITLIIVVGILLFAVFGFVAYISLSSTNTVTGNGQASIDAMPDLVTVYFNLESQGATSKEATDKNSEKVDELTTSLIKQGFEKKEIQTQNFNVYPDYNWNNGRQTLKGYKATQTIRIEMPTSETSKIGSVIDAGVEAGAGISYINFELSQELQNQYKAEAIKLAAEDAKIKASAIAEGLNKRLGRLVSTSDSNFDYYPWKLYEASGVADAESAKQATTNIQPGEQKISASVTAVFKLR